MPERSHVLSDNRLTASKTLAPGRDLMRGTSFT